MRAVFLTLLTLIPFVVRAQFYFERKNEVPVSYQGKSLLNPWIGGLNAPQFSEIDVNLDGVKDLMVFDRSTNSLLTFINKGTANTIDYHYAPQYESAFPNVQNWCITADYDADGKFDLFSCSNGGIRVYRNTSSTKLSFQLMATELKAQYPTFKTGLYVNNTDIPALLDVDKDGDMDVLTFELGTGSGDAMYYYRNRSVEKYGNADSLDMALEDHCWGRFREDPFNCDVALDSCTGAKPLSSDSMIAQRSMHTGSTVTALDVNGDDLVDLLIGDISCSSMYLLTNGGTKTDAHMVSQTLNYPNEHPISLQLFPAAFQLDVNNDTKKDLIVSPNAKYNGNNYSNCWLYVNTGSSEHPIYTFQTDRFLQDESIDLGEGVYPAAVDVDADGLQDLIVGNVGYSSGNGVYSAGLAYFKNTGTATAPAFELKNTNWGNTKGQTFKDLKWNALFPSFADLDQDGDVDLALGDREKSLNLFFNRAGKNDSIDLVFDTNYYKYQSIDVGQFASPFLIDADADGKTDAIIGEQQGNFNYYRNQGLTTPDFQLVKDTLGKVRLEGKSTSNAFSNCWIGDWNNDGDLEMIASRSDGMLFLLDIPNNDLSSSFVKLDSFLSHMGNRISFAVADWNNDGKKDLVVGSYRGGLALFEQAEKPVPVEEHALLPELQIYPNPFREHLFIINQEQGFVNYLVLDLTGRLLHSYAAASGTTEMDLSELPAGAYLLVAKGFRTRLLIKQ